MSRQTGEGSGTVKFCLRPLRFMQRARAVLCQAGHPRFKHGMLGIALEKADEVVTRLGHNLPKLRCAEGSSSVAEQFHELFDELAS